ncbi:MAG: pilus assembly protein PilM [Nitrospirae bacterium]|nr:pilus assembly protein PilM [Nitrospirota bacterium]
MTETAVDNKLTSLFSASISGLKERWESVWRVLTFSLADALIAQRKNITVAIEKGSLSVACASKLFSRITIKGGKTYSFEEGRYPQPDELVSSLALSINELGTAMTDLTLSIPKLWAIIRSVELPSTVKENLSDAISYEMDRLTPFTSEEVFYDYKILRESDDKVYLLVMAVRTDTIKPYLAALDESGFSVSRVTINLAGMGVLCRYIYQESNTVFVEINRDGSEGALFIDGSLTALFSDAFSASPLQVEKLKAYDTADIETLSKKIRALIDNAKGAEMTSQIVLHLKEKIPALKEMLESKIGTPVKIFGEGDAPTGFKTTSAGLMISGNEISYAAIGSAIQSLQHGAETPDMLKRGIRKKQRPPLALTVILLIVIAFMWALYTVAPIGIEEKRLEEISRQIEMRRDDINKIEAMKKEAEGLVSEINFINGYKRDMPMTLDILKELTSLLPKTAWLTKAKIAGSSLEIGGYALSATELLPKLEASEYFSKVEFTSPTIRDQAMKSDRFTIKMDINKPLQNSVEKRNNEKK